MRLIDADELLKQAYEPYEMKCESCIGINSDVQVVTVADINAMPTIDTERHGHWILHRQSPYSRQWVCSKCGYIRELSKGIVLPKACENCRAKMDEGVN